MEATLADRALSGAGRESSGLTLPEASIIVEYLDSHRQGPQPLLPADADLRLEVRLLDRFFDDYVHASLQKIVSDRIRAAERRDAQGVDEAHAMLDTCYGWLDQRMADRGWAAGEGFTLADCAAAPALFYADWVHPIGDAVPNVAAYRARLLARPSVKRAVNNARPFRHLFPGGAPAAIEVSDYAASELRPSRDENWKPHSRPRSGLGAFRRSSTSAR